MRGRSIRVEPLDRSAVQLPQGLPVDPCRVGLYSAEELYDTEAYADTVDAAAFAWSRVRTADATLAQAVHDHAVDEALEAWVRGRRLVGVMGGHDSQRGDAVYAEAARFGHAVGAGLTVATGGGPGSMEAANLGAYLSGAPADELEHALQVLASAPSYRPSVDAWLSAAREVARTHPSGTASLGIPTWFYGHEPTNLFATGIAKYFRNALREAILLQICDAGIVFLPGLAGTVQEVFQDGCENFYADEEHVAPMVLVGHRYWTQTLPVWSLLQSLARGRVMEPHVHLVETIEEAAALLAR